MGEAMGEIQAVARVQTRANSILIMIGFIFICLFLFFFFFDVRV